MRVSYTWLRDLIDVPESPDELSREYIRTGTEVEAIETVGDAFEHVVTAQVVSKEPHPDSDHMWVTKVDVGRFNLGEDGEPEPLQIVCGAQNFEAGDHIVTALVGAELPGGIKIKKSKLRGVVSWGMNCSARELGLSGDHSGIMILPEDAPVGVPFAEYHNTADTVLDCEITPNRPDCLSMIGMAVETSAIFDRDTHIELPRIQHEDASVHVDDLVEVRVDDPELCSRYTARVVRGVKIGPSPEWLASRVAAAGMRPINNVVDVTNYVMMLTGQPLHAFDLGKLSEREGRRHVVVRAAHEGEQIQTLDGVERTLSADMCVITDDGERPVCLAGVMGSLDSEIDETTHDVLLEAACFDSSHISRTSRNLSLISEASIRYERQVDRTRCDMVSSIAAALFEQCCGATVVSGAIDVYPVPAEPVTLTLRPARACAIAGTDIPAEFMSARLTRLGCTVETAADGTLAVTVPTNRPDLEREIDLIEEIVRLWGMDRVPATIPAARNHIGGLTHDQRLVREVGQILRACGLNETLSYAFAAPGDLERCGMSDEGRGVPVKIMRPLVAEQSEMRRTLLPGLLTSVAYNEAHGHENVHLYEIGTLFHGRENASLPKENQSVAGVLSGTWGDISWNQKYAPLRFFDGKGIVEELLAQLRVEKVRFRPAEGEGFGFLQPGRGAEVLSGGTVLGWVGEIHPEVRASYDIALPVVAFELSLDALLRAAHDQGAYAGFSTYPSVDVDLAIVVDESVTYETLVQRLTSAGGKLLRDVRLFDVYRDEERVGAGKKSMAFALTYRADDHTLTSDEVERVHGKLVTKVCRAVGGEVRG